MMDVNSAVQHLRHCFAQCEPRQLLGEVEDMQANIAKIGSSEIITEEEFKSWLCSMRSLCILRVAALDARSELGKRSPCSNDPFFLAAMGLILKIEAVVLPRGPEGRSMG